MHAGQHSHSAAQHRNRPHPPNLMNAYGRCTASTCEPYSRPNSPANSSKYWNASFLGYLPPVCSGCIVSKVPSAEAVPACAALPGVLHACAVACGAYVRGDKQPCNTLDAPLCQPNAPSLCKCQEGNSRFQYVVEHIFPRLHCHLWGLIGGLLCKLLEEALQTKARTKHVGVRILCSSPLHQEHSLTFASDLYCSISESLSPSSPSANGSPSTILAIRVKRTISKDHQIKVFRLQLDTQQLIALSQTSGEL